MPGLQLMCRLAVLHCAAGRTATDGYKLPSCLPPWGREELDAEVESLAKFGYIAAHRAGGLGQSQLTEWAVSYLTDAGSAHLRESS